MKRITSYAATTPTVTPIYTTIHVNGEDCSTHVYTSQFGPDSIVIDSAVSDETNINIDAHDREDLTLTLGELRAYARTLADKRLVSA